MVVWNIWRLSGASNWYYLGWTIDDIMEMELMGVLLMEKQFKLRGGGKETHPEIIDRINRCGGRRPPADIHTDPNGNVVFYVGWTGGAALSIG